MYLVDYNENDVGNPLIHRLRKRFGQNLFWECFFAIYADLDLEWPKQGLSTISPTVRASTIILVVPMKIVRRHRSRRLENIVGMTYLDTSDSPDKALNSVHLILVLLAHPSLDRSEVNRPMADAIRRLNGITLVDLYAEYPDFQIDIDREQQRLLTHDAIVFHYSVRMRLD